MVKRQFQIVYNKHPNLDYLGHTSPGTGMGQTHTLPTYPPTYIDKVFVLFPDTG